jgi:hypothetical protein
MAPTFTFLSQKHPAYIAQIDQWTRNIRRFQGGQAVFQELIRFDWETRNGDHYVGRQRQATYLNFPERFASTIVGQMMVESPLPNFGTLGEVRRERDVNNPTPAEQLWYNVDGVGQDGSQWVPWWTYVAKKAVNTGVEWLYVESPKEAPKSQEEEQSGKRPFFRNFGAPAVTNWHFENGSLAFAVIQRRRRRPGADKNGNVIGNRGDKEYLFFCREGYDAFDAAGLPFSAGGWFLFDEQYEFLNFGLWTPTNGEIPMVPLYYDRLKSDDGDFSLARSGTTELGNAAVAYMNIASAADYDAWDSGQSIQALAGVDEEGYKLFVDALAKGSKFAPLIRNEQSGQNPTVTDLSMGEIIAQVFDIRLKAKREEALELMLDEVKRGPDTSGDSLDATFASTRAPRLALFAGEIETAQNAMIRWTEMGWGNAAPKGEVKWKRKFRLIDPMSAAREFYETANLSKVRSATLDADVMMQAAESRGFVLNDEKGATIRSEFEASARKQVAILNTPVPIAGQPGRPGEGNGKGAPGTPGRTGAPVASRNGGRGTASTRKTPRT